MAASERDDRSGQLPETGLPLSEIGDVDEIPVRELSDLAAEDVDDDIEVSNDAYGEPDDVFAENAEIAFEARDTVAREAGATEVMVDTVDAGWPEERAGDDDDPAAPAE